MLITKAMLPKHLYKTKSLGIFNTNLPYSIIICKNIEIFTPKKFNLIFWGK
jgi:hypothetical protein